MQKMAFQTKLVIKEKTMTCSKHYIKFYGIKELVTTYVKFFKK